MSTTSNLPPLSSTAFSLSQRQFNDAPRDRYGSLLDSQSIENGRYTFHSVIEFWLTRDPESIRVSVFSTIKPITVANTGIFCPPVEGSHLS